MYEYDLQEVLRLTGLSAATREMLSRYYVQLPEEIRIEAHKIQSDLVRQARTKKNSDKASEFFYAQFLIALHMMHTLESGADIHSKKNLTPEELKKIGVIRKRRIQLAHRKNPGRTRKIVEIRFYELIEKLRGEGLSWRDISKYIARFHRHKISYTYLKLCFDQITTERKIGQGEI